MSLVSIRGYTMLSIPMKTHWKGETLFAILIASGKDNLHVEMYDVTKPCIVSPLKES